VKIHVFVTLAASAMFHESRATALDLNPASGFLLDMLYISSTVANNLSTKIKSWDLFKIDWNLLLGPFTLIQVSDHNLAS
jgi:hypothetical protein